MSRYGDEHEALAQLDTLLHDLEDQCFHPQREMLDKLRGCIGILSGLIATAEKLEAEVERLKKKIEELEEPFPPDNDPVVWTCPPNNLEKRFERKDKP